MHFPLNDDYIRVGISLTVDYVYDNHHALIPVSSYGQLDTGVLGWVFEGEFNTSQGKLTVKLPIVASECGAYKGVGVVNSTEFATKFEIIEKTSAKTEVQRGIK